MKVTASNGNKDLGQTNGELPRGDHGHGFAVNLQTIKKYYPMEIEILARNPGLLDRDHSFAESYSI